jgi:quinol monooxygenase YgiN
MNPGGVYVAIWEFTAKPEARAEFENFYGPDGEWVQLFRRSKSFLRTELFRDRNAENHYVTMDYFASKAGYDDFLREFRQEYDALDRRCDAVLEGEKEVGVFLALGGSSFRAGA